MSARERLVRVVAEALFEEERNASMGFDHWPESFNAMDALGQGAYLDLAEAVVAALEANATHQPRNDTDVVSPADEPPIDPRAGSVRLAGCSEGGREQG